MQHFRKDITASYLGKGFVIETPNTMITYNSKHKKKEKISRDIYWISFLYIRIRNDIVVKLYLNENMDDFLIVEMKHINSYIVSCNGGKCKLLTIFYTSLLYS